MGVALFIVPEREVPGLDTNVDGKALGRSRWLDRLTREAGVRPLVEFFSITPEEVAEAAKEFGEEPPADGLPPEEWFSAEDGLASVRGLLAHLDVRPTATPDADALRNDLRQFEEVLSGLVTAGVRWHLAVDC